MSGHRAPLLIAGTAVGITLFVAAASSLAHSGGSFESSFGTAVVDGARSPGEWDAALQVHVSDAPAATLFVMNDEANLYLALAVEDTLGEDSFEVRFDNAHNGVADDGDDELDLAGTGAFSDLHFAGSSWSVFDLSQDGAGAVAHAGGVTFFEISHPLDSGDANDIAVAHGETLGFAMRYVDAPSFTSVQFPPTSFSSGPGSFADLKIVGALDFWVGEERRESGAGGTSERRARDRRSESRKHGGAPLEAG